MRTAEAAGIGLLSAPATGENPAQAEGHGWHEHEWCEMAADGQAGHKKVAPALQSREGGSDLHVLMGTEAEGLGSSTALWKTA